MARDRRVIRIGALIAIVQNVVFWYSSVKSKRCDISFSIGQRFYILLTLDFTNTLLQEVLYSLL